MTLPPTFGLTAQNSPLKVATHSLGPNLRRQVSDVQKTPQTDMIISYHIMIIFLRRWLKGCFGPSSWLFECVFGADFWAFLALFFCTPVYLHEP